MQGVFIVAALLGSVHKSAGLLNGGSIIALRRSTTSKRQATFGRIPQRQLRMVATPEKAGTTKTLAKIEQIKIDSMQLREPLLTEMKNDEIFVSHDAYQILKYHGSYQQDNRELRKPKQQKAYSFMLRLKMPCGEVPAHLYRLLDDLCDEFGEHNLRATTRQAFQVPTHHPPPNPSPPRNSPHPSLRPFAPFRCTVS